MDTVLGSRLTLLSADEWLYIAPFLASGDVIRLLSCGSPLLADRVRRGARHMRLTWIPARPMLFEEVLAPLSRLNHVLDFEFRTKSEIALSWVPINWSLLPTSLTSINLCFFGAVSHFMSQEHLNNVLPNLERLVVRHVAHRHAPHDPTVAISFVGLPSGLRELRLLGLPYVYLYIDELQQLPSKLEILSLKVLPSVLEGTKATNEAVGAGMNLAMLPRVTKVELPRLPPGLTYLSMAPGEVARTSWHIDCAKLPRTLTFLRINRSIRVGPFVTTGNTIDPSGISEHLVHLKSLITPAMVITMAQIEKFVPPSVTALEMAIKSKDLESTSRHTLEFVARRMESIQLCDKEVIKVLLDGTMECPRLRKVLTYESGLVFPASMTIMTSFRGMNGPWPKALKEVAILYRREIVSDLPFSQESLLVRMTFDEMDLTADIISLLPNTLEHLAILLPPKEWLLLTSEMRTPGRLPNLRSIGHKGNPFSPAELLELPNQLEELRISSFTFDKHEILDQALLDSFKASSLRTLGITIEQNSLEHHLALLNALPDTLTNLTIKASHRPKPSWKLNLPKKLEIFDYNYSQPWTEKGAMPSSDYPISNPDFLLPQGLRSLLLSNTPLVWTLEQMPPYLSILNHPESKLPISDPDGYWLSRAPPKGHLNLKLHMLSR